LDEEIEYQTLIRRSRRLVGLALTLVFAMTIVGGLLPMRFLGRAWSEDDVFECRASAFVAEAGGAGDGAAEVAMTECLTHRREQRWGPWGAFGDANDLSKYKAADD
jgi:hypothetical protein